MQKATYPFLQGGGEMGQLTRLFDWASTPVGDPSEWPQSLRTTVSNILRSRFPMFLWWGEDMIQFYNDAYRPSLGNEGKHPSALGARGKDCWPEIWDIISPLHRHVQTTGEATWMEDQLVPIYRNGKIEDVYWTYSYSSVLDDEGEHAGILVTCTETTSKVEMVNKLKNSEQRFQNLIREATVGIIVVTGEDMVVEVVNDAFGKLIDRTSADLVGKPFFDILPEARPHFHHTVENVRLTGEALYLYDNPYFYILDGIKKEGYLNIVYQPYKEKDGDITGVMILCQDMTEKVLARKKIEEADERARLSMHAHEYLQHIINKFETALCSLTPVTEDGKLIDFRFKMTNEAYGQYSNVNPEEIQGRTITSVFPEYQTTGAFEKYVETYQTGKANNWELHYNVDGLDNYLIISASKMGEELVVHINDITQLKNLQLDLIRKVEELQRSNKNLEEFAYAASHDLKEPIRKIHFFSERIRSSLAERFSQEETNAFVRMELAAKRMNSLIDDLLSYSQVSFLPHAFEYVHLDSVVAQVMEDLDIEIEERQALIEIGHLCVVKGNHRQLQQAFQNLLINSLKYSRPGVAPRIQVFCQKLVGHTIPLHIPAEQMAREFWAITIRDNGIGFEQKEAERIFNVFTRLHGNSEFNGSGIGLSIVRKVIENHQGFITAQGETGKGACFIVYLPAE